MNDVSAAPKDNAFLRRMTAACSWGEGVDGYDLGVISVTLPFLARSLGASPLDTGLIGA